MNVQPRFPSCTAIGLPLLLAGCASTVPPWLPESADSQITTQWHAPLPHGGQVDDLRQWWARFDDPLVPRLIEAAQRASPTLAQATANMADARALRVTRGAALLPSLDGPVAVTFPLFDGGTRRANAEAARARYEAAAAVYAARLRTAIQEVEGALVALESSARRGESASVATDGFERSYRATAAGHVAGAASLFDLEDARRSLVSARGSLIDLHRERLLAWVSLYRSMGGGWSPPAAEPPAGESPLPGATPRNR